MMKYTVTEELPREERRPGAPEEQGRISEAVKRDLRVQQWMGWIFLLPVYLLVGLIIHLKFRLKIENHAEIRRKFREIAKTKRPLLICSNHLTLVDSIIVMWAIGSPLDYLLNFRLFCWNVPAIENYKKHPTWRVLTYLGKCVPIDRGGSREYLDEILNTIAYLLRQGELCMLFPEGTRSRTGRINPESVTYGVGKLLKKVPECEILCIYHRGLGQETYSDFPKKGETFRLEMDVIRPESKHQGLRAIRDYSLQTISKLKEMEDRFFARNG